MNKKYISLFLALVMVASVFVGCSDKQNDKQDEQPQTSSEEGSKKTEEGTQQKDEDFQYITADELETIVTDENSDYAILDVRKKADYDTEHIKGSISADVDSVVSDSDNDPAKGNVENALEEVGSKDKKFVLLCYSGKKYAQAATGLLKKAGVDADNIYTLEGGYKGWTFSDLLEK